jgi:putative ATP-binding cassette transporter
LVGLNFKQLDKEADFRATLIHVRDNAELIALTRREGRLHSRLLGRIEALAENMRRIFVVNRNLGFFSTGYFNLIQIIPVLVVAPLFFRGEVEFGVITQSAMAFALLVGAFSLVVSQFQPISSFTAVLSRLNQLWEAMEQVRQTDISKIEIAEADGSINYEHLTLYSPDDGRVLLRDLSLSIPHGTRVLISGPNQAAKLALFKATAGMYNRGEGKIIRPNFENIRFLPQRAYLYPGTLRELLMRSGEEHSISDERMLLTLRELGLGTVLSRVGGLDVSKIGTAHYPLAKSRFWRSPGCCSQNPSSLFLTECTPH